MSSEPTETAYIVVDFWRARPDRESELERALTESATAFRAQPGVLSVDFTRVEDDPGRYLVVSATTAPPREPPSSVPPSSAIR